jgi:1,2-diacylglycerol 3-beta-glucosyltransferase
VTTSLLLPGLLLVLLLAWPLYNLMLVSCTLTAAKPVRVADRPTAHVRNYWIVIPALNEEKVIANTVSAALALHRPRTPVRVLVVDDASDDRTAAILEGIQNPRLHVLRRELPAARNGKGEALNAAYNWIRCRADVESAINSTIIGVIDGDGRGSDGLLDVVDALFDDRQVGAVQCRVRIHNRQRMLGLLQDIEFTCVANASQMLRDMVDSVGMGGNGQFTRLAELFRFGDRPWSRCLVEDLELGLRLHLNGVRIRYSRSATITQQAVVDPKRLLRQRTRWAQGNLQCAGYLKQLLRSRQVGSMGLLDYLHYLVAPWLVVPMSLLIGATAVATLVLIAVGSSFRLVASGDELFAALMMWWCDARARSSLGAGPSTQERR